MLATAWVVVDVWLTTELPRFESPGCPWRRRPLRSVAVQYVVSLYEKFIPQLSALLRIQPPLGLFNVTVDGSNQGLQRVEALFRADVSQNEDIQDLAIEILLKPVNQVSLHGFLGVLVEGVPADAHNHLVHVPGPHTRPAEVHPSADVGWEVLHNRVRKVR